MRCVLIALMIFSRIPDLIYGTYPPPEKEHEMEFFDMEGISKALPVLLFTMNFHFLVPYISQNFCSHGDKSRRIITYSTICVAFIYIALGAVVGYALKDLGPESTSTNAWRNYGKQFDPQYPWWSYIIKYSVTLFPAVSMISTGPVAAVSLAESLQSYMNIDKGKNSIASEMTIGRIIAMNTLKSLGNQSLKLLVWIIPLTVSVFVVYLSTVAGWTGVVIYYTLYINSSMLYIAAARKVPVKSPYSGWHSNILLSLLIIIIASLGMSFNLYGLVYRLIANYK